ncbi:PDZ domain-containing protein [Clostridium peptidivorans]|uniref:PDZ domain-containing protein n=1 Tax=Clostridium peptidivorans TaxID=100174 RepID=UPI000BE37E76|nr:PDZ domain-containing protein [Clostridium peptidivorans]
MNILIYTLRTLAITLTDPYYIFFLAILVFMLYKRNRKISIMQKMIIGEPLYSPFELTISQLVLGIFAGILASIMMSYLGVIYYGTEAIEILFMTSIFLAIFSPKFICFSYSAAILGALSIILTILYQNAGVGENTFLRVDIPSLIATVAVLHFVEGILIIIDGKKGNIPVFRKVEGEIQGGFAFKRYWTVPVALFIMINTSLIPDLGTTEPMPNWWPIIKTSIPAEMLKKSVVALIPFYAMLGYKSNTFTQTKNQKTLMSGLFVIAYSMALFLVAQLAHINIFFQALAVAFAPVGHEAMLRIQAYFENTMEAKYVSRNGVMVLEVSPNSIGGALGIKSEDTIVEINEEEVKTEEDISRILNSKPESIFFKVRNSRGEIRKTSKHPYQKGKIGLGMLIVPKKVDRPESMRDFENENFSDILDKIKNDKEDGDE